MMNAFGFNPNYYGGCFDSYAPQPRHCYSGGGYGHCNPYSHARPQWGGGGCDAYGYGGYQSPYAGYGYLNQADASASAYGRNAFAFSDAYADENKALGLAGAYASPDDYALALAYANARNGNGFSLGLTPENATFGLNLGGFSLSGALPWS
jgi:hypothetical protein